MGWGQSPPSCKQFVPSYRGRKVLTVELLRLCPNQPPTTGSEMGNDILPSKTQPLSLVISRPIITPVFNFPVVCSALIKSIVQRKSPPRVAPACSTFDSWRLDRAEGKLLKPIAPENDSVQRTITDYARRLKQLQTLLDDQRKPLGIPIFPPPPSCSPPSSSSFFFLRGGGGRGGGGGGRGRELITTERRS